MNLTPIAAVTKEETKENQFANFFSTKNKNVIIFSTRNHILYFSGPIKKFANYSFVYHSLTLFLLVAAFHLVWPGLNMIRKFIYVYLSLSLACKATKLKLIVAKYKSLAVWIK